MRIQLSRAVVRWSRFYYRTKGEITKRVIYFRQEIIGNDRSIEVDLAYKYVLAIVKMPSVPIFHRGQDFEVLSHSHFQNSTQKLLAHLE